MNNFNVSNTCPICLTNPVDHFMDPCGHTICKDCLLNTFKRNGNSTDIYAIGRGDDFHCSFCREKVKSVRSLYFI